MIVVLDTNAFRGDAKAERPQLQLLLAGARAGDYELAIPNVVLAELTKQYPERVDAALRDANVTLGRVARDFLALGIPALPPLDVDQDRLKAAYAGDLAAGLKSAGVQVAPTPPDLSETVGWAVNRRKPFKPNGQGLPDAVIWLTALDLASKTDELVLVTANSADFAADDDSSILAPDLLQDLRERGLPPARIRIMPDVQTLLEQRVGPLGEPSARARRIFSDRRLFGLLSDAITAAVLYAPIPQSGLDLEIPLDEDPQPRWLELEFVDRDSVRELNNGRLLLEVRALADMSLAMHILHEDVDDLSADSPIEISDYEWNERYAEGEVEALVELTLRVSTDPRVLAPEIEIVEAARLSPPEVAELRLTHGSSKELLQMLANAKAGLAVDGYVPPDGLEAIVDRATIRAWSEGRVELDEIEDLQGFGIRATFNVRASVDIEWVVNSPTPKDVRTYPEANEGGTGDAGWLNGFAGREPVLVTIRAILGPGWWDEIEVQSASVDRAANGGQVAASTPTGWTRGASSATEQIALTGDP